MKNGKAEKNPAQGVKHLKENNERDRILSPEEYTRLLAHCPAHLKPIVKVAYHTGMRQGEILNLTWGQVDLKEGFIRLRPEDTKTNEGRLCPLTGNWWRCSRPCPGLAGSEGVCLPRESLWQQHFRKLLTRPGSGRGLRISPFTTCGIRPFNNGDGGRAMIYFVIMAATGHKTMNVFKRYNTVRQGGIEGLGGGKSVTIFTYIFTRDFSREEMRANFLE